MKIDYEKLGSLYLGREFDGEKGELGENLVLYDSKDLVTHMAIIGMTGSGKTGLGIGVLEECGIDKIPAIIIDPKGDLANLLLTFPELRPEDFRPWINEDEATQMGISGDDLARQQAEKWKTGLAEWDQSGERIQKLRDTCETVVYTPASKSGIPVSILSALNAPKPEILEDEELFADKITSLVASLLGLIGFDGEPLESREYVLLANIFKSCWEKQQDITLSDLVKLVHEPPMQQVGVIDVNAFYPADDRFKLAMKFNNLIASPGFAAWLEGEPLDPDRLLFNDEGKPKLAVFSIAHLNDQERMFFVSLLLNQILGWIRTQPGTTSLRSVLYMDEVFGYLPPTANPPSKKPLLTLLKQARAFGLGIILSTQNPVDLDYKALSNIGTWMLGRLQTDGDKQRVLDGLVSAGDSAGGQFDRSSIDRLLSNLGKRVFLMHNVHEPKPKLMQTRWTLSYLAGPLTKNQIKFLTDENRSNHAVETPVAAAELTAAVAKRPLLSNDILQYFVPVSVMNQPGETLIYRPNVFGAAQYTVKLKEGITEPIQTVAGFGLTEGVSPVDWQNAQKFDFDLENIEQTPFNDSAGFETIPPPATDAKNFAAWQKEFVNRLMLSQEIQSFTNGLTKLSSLPNEEERDFRIRVDLAMREMRDDEVEKLRAKFADKVNRLNERLNRAEDKKKVQQSQATNAKLNSVLTVGMGILGSLFGGRKSSVITKVGGAARGAGRIMRESTDVSIAEDNITEIQQQISDLQTQAETEVAALSSRFESDAAAISSVSNRPKKTDISVTVFGLGWLPFWVSENNEARQAW